MLNTFTNKANYPATPGRKMVLINRGQSDLPKHLCNFQSFSVRKEIRGSYESIIFVKVKQKTVLVCAVFT